MFNAITFDKGRFPIELKLKLNRNLITKIFLKNTLKVIKKYLLRHIFEKGQAS